MNEKFISDYFEIFAEELISYDVLKVVIFILESDLTSLQKEILIKQFLDNKITVGIVSQK